MSVEEQGSVSESSEGEDLSQYAFMLKTVQTSAMRILIEAVKEIITDANLIISKNGIKIMTMDPSHTILIHLKLDAKKFEQFHCENDMTIGEKNSLTTFKLNLMDLPKNYIDIPPASFESVLTMPSNDFQKICRDMNNIAENLEIKSIESQLIFSCKGDFATQETIIGETNTGLSFKKNNQPKEVVQGIFALKHLVLFTKCTNLCNTIEIYLKNDYPLIIKYSIASLGDIKLCLAPKNMDD